MVNAAELINKDCTLTSINGSVIDAEGIQRRKRFLKEQIYNLLGTETLNKTIFINHNSFEWSVSGVLASWELGCNIFLHDLNHLFTRIPEFADFYNFIDLSIVLDKNKFTLFNTPMVDVRDYSTYDYTFDKIVDVAPDTVAVKTHTSGTTGIPRIIDFTHQHLIDRTKIMSKFHGYDSTDKPFHFKTFHHGGLFIDYALPLLFATKEHYFLPTTTYLTGDSYNAQAFLNLVMPFIKDNKLTAIMMPYEWINYFNQSTPVDTEGRLTIKTLRGYDSETCCWIFENINPKSIVNQFGCSEVGTMFLSRATQQNYKHHVPTKFEEIAPGLDYKLEKNLIHVCREPYEWHTLSDSFEQDETGLWYKGRSYSFYINDTLVPIQDLENYLRTIYNPSKFQLVPDFSNNKIYLALFDPVLDTDIVKINKMISDNVSPNHCVEAVRYFNLPDVLSGIKPSGQILLYAFTQN